MEKFCKDLKDQAMKIINYEKKVINYKKKSYEKQKVCYIYEKEFSTDKNNETKFKLYHKVIIQETLEEQLIIFVI